MSLDVRCRCGQVYHADPAHAGRRIRCRCGRTLKIPRPGRLLRLPRIRVRRPKFLRFPKWAVALARVAVWAYLSTALLATLVLWWLGDEWWLATVMLFGHRWLLLLPAFPLAVAALAIRARVFPVVLLASLVVLGPFMGFRTGWRAWLRGAAEPELTLATFNVEGNANPRTDEIPGVLESLGADLMLFQECTARLAEAAARLEAWAVWRVRGLCMASRYPIDSSAVMEEFEVSAGSIGNVAFHVVRHPAGPLRVGLLHLETPRSGLAGLRYRGELSQLRRNLIMREGGSSRASRWLDGLGAEIFAGDFNMPVESRIYRRYWGDCANAFSRTGRGFGYTRVLLRFSVRIDHVLTCRGWEAVRTWVGPDLGSDHLPVIAELRRRPG